MTEKLQQWIGLDIFWFFDFFSDYGGPIGWWLAIQTVFYVFGILVGVRISVIAFVAMITNSWLKWLVAAPRPYFIDASINPLHVVQGFGMPSGHAQGSAVVWGWFALNFRRTGLAFVVLTVIALVGISRVYFGVHSVAQVLVGWCIAGAMLWCYWCWHERVEQWLSHGGWRFQVSAIFLLGVFAAGISLLILWLRQDFTTPQVWVDNFARANLALTEAGVADDGHMRLLTGGELFLIPVAMGYLLIGVCQGLWPLSAPATWRWPQRLLNLCLGAVITIGCLQLIGPLIPGSGSTDSVAAKLLIATPVLLVLPLVSIFFPLKLIDQLVGRKMAPQWN